MPKRLVAARVDGELWAEAQKLTGESSPTRILEKALREWLKLRTLSSDPISKLAQLLSLLGLDRPQRDAICLLASEQLSRSQHNLKQLLECAGIPTGQALAICSQLFPKKQVEPRR